MSEEQHKELYSQIEGLRSQLEECYNTQEYLRASLQSIIDRVDETEWETQHGLPPQDVAIITQELQDFMLKAGLKKCDRPCIFTGQFDAGCWCRDNNVPSQKLNPKG